MLGTNRGSRASCVKEHVAKKSLLLKTTLVRVISPKMHFPVEKFAVLKYSTLECHPDDPQNGTGRFISKMGNSSFAKLDDSVDARIREKMRGCFIKACANVTCMRYSRFAWALWMWCSLSPGWKCLVSHWMHPPLSLLSCSDVTPVAGSRAANHNAARAQNHPRAFSLSLYRLHVFFQSDRAMLCRLYGCTVPIVTWRE